VLSSIFLDFWNKNFIENIFCFISLLMCLEVEVIKRQLWPLNEPAAPFQNGKKPEKMAFNFVFNSSYNFRAREKFIK